MSLDSDGEQVARLRKLCGALPGVNEKLAWGTPCFYAGKKLFAMFSDDHHLRLIDDVALKHHLIEAWRLTATKTLLKQWQAAGWCQ